MTRTMIVDEVEEDEKWLEHIANSAAIDVSWNVCFQTVRGYTWRRAFGGGITIAR